MLNRDAEAPPTRDSKSVGLRSGKKPVIFTSTKIPKYSSFENYSPRDYLQFYSLKSEASKTTADSIKISISVDNNAILQSPENVSSAAPEHLRATIRFNQRPKSQTLNTIGVGRPVNNRSYQSLCSFSVSQRLCCFPCIISNLHHNPWGNYPYIHFTDEETVSDRPKN